MFETYRGIHDPDWHFFGLGLFTKFTACYLLCIQKIQNVLARLPIFPTPIKFVFISSVSFFSFYCPYEDERYL